jgi:UDP-glucose 4-epimerase
VLGGKGFIGSHVVEALLLHGYKVRVLGKQGSPLIDPKFIGEVDWCDGDFTNQYDVEKAVEGCDFCFHLVSTTLPKSSNDDPVYDLDSNVISTIRFLEAASKSGLKKVIFISSGGTVYGIPKYIPIDEEHPTNPICSYGISKLAVEKYLALYRTLRGLDYTILRLSNPFGERQRISAGQGAIAVFLGKALRGETIEIWGDGTVTRDYIYISDVIDAMLSAIDYKGDYRLFNIGSGRPATLLDVLSNIEGVLGLKVKKNFIKGRSFDVPVNVLKIDVACRELGWSPKISMQEGILKMVGWLEKSGDAWKGM